MAKGTATSYKMMPNMETYGGQNNPGYHPPTGNAGAAGRGEYSNKKNPLSVPAKGSSIGMVYGNADRQKIMEMKNAQAMKENLRGKCC